jgi:hypothetical protein
MRIRIFLQLPPFHLLDAVVSIVIESRIFTRLNVVGVTGSLREKTPTGITDGSWVKLVFFFFAGLPGEL